MLICNGTEEVLTLAIQFLIVVALSVKTELFITLVSSEKAIKTVLASVVSKTTMIGLLILANCLGEMSKSVTIVAIVSILVIIIVKGIARLVMGVEIVLLAHLLNFSFYIRF